jgi:hypothetical protein
MGRKEEMRMKEKKNRKRKSKGRGDRQYQKDERRTKKRSYFRSRINPADGDNGVCSMVCDTL